MSKSTKHHRQRFKKLPIREVLKHENFKKVQTISLLAIGVFLIINITTYFVYTKKTYPKSFLNNTNIGNTNFDILEQTIQNTAPLPGNINLALGDRKIDAPSSDIGISIDYQRTTSSIQRNRSLIPLFNLFQVRHNYTDFNLDNPKLLQFLESKKSDLETAPIAKKIQKTADGFQISNPIPGSQIDINKSTNTVLDQLNSRAQEIILPQITNDPPAPSIDLDAELSRLNNSLNLSINLTYKGRKSTLSKQQLLEIYQPDKETFIPNDEKISTIIDQVSSNYDVKPGNRSTIINQIRSALNKQQNIAIEIEPAPERTLTYYYCVATKGVSEAYLGEFKSKLAAVYADERGWGLGNKIKFIPVNNNCSFTAWLTEASLVPSFSPSICDSTWSCRVGKNVIINFDRWVGASPAWNSAGGSLDNYRSMVINHETGHWLGFGHRYCGGSNQPAPVMQQQSIGLQGCSFNPWPTSPELNSLKSSKNL